MQTGYPTGKPIDDNDKLAEPLPDGSGRWTCGEYKIEELNKRKCEFLDSHSSIHNKGRT